MICPNCKQENKSTNIRCEFCSTQLIDVNEYTGAPKIKVSTKKAGCLSNILILLFAGPWLFIGIIFLGIGLLLSILDNKQTTGYEKTTATFKEYTDCTHSDGSELCDAVYEYQVDGITYSVSPDLSTNRGNFKEKDIVYYNPNNPSESIMKSPLNMILIIIGITIISIIIFIFIAKNIIIKKISKGKDNITLNISNSN